MLYIFLFLIICSFINQRKKIFTEKRNLALFLVISAAGIALGVIHNVSPYIPSIAAVLEQYMK